MTKHFYRLVGLMGAMALSAGFWVEVAKAAQHLVP